MISTPQAIYVTPTPVMDHNKTPFQIGFSLLIAFSMLLLLRTCSQSEAKEMEITAEGLAIGDQVFPSFSDFADPETLWGKARLEEGTINDLLIWDKQGLCIFKEAGSDRVVSLHLALVASGEPTRPMHPYSSTFMVNHAPLNAKMPVAALKSAGFKALADSGWYKLTVGKFRLSAFTEDGLLKTLELSPVE